MRTLTGIGLAILLGLVSGVGCDISAPSGPPAEVEGTVSYDGQPVESGIIAFLPAEGGDRPSGGGAVQGGKYRVFAESGLKPGKYRVEIRWAKVVGKKEKVEYGQSPDIIEEGLPAMYNAESTLTAELKAGPNKVDFNLEAADTTPAAVKFGKLSAEVPTDWKSEKPANRLRSHQFKLPSGADGVADAELYAMPESNPNPEKSFPRWKESFVPPDSKTLDDIAKVSKFEVNGATVHLLDVSGTWKYRDRPFDPKSKEEARPDYRVVWAIVSSGEEATHLRLSGPRAVVEKQYPAFEKWLKSLK